jgi:heme b synthase
MNGPNTRQLRMVFWETTAACNLRCAHCRVETGEDASRAEMTFDQACSLLNDIASFSTPVIVLSGGEPLVRRDIIDIARFGSDLGLRMALATNGTLVTPEIARDVKTAGVVQSSVSLDGADAAVHDAFRRVPGAFDSAIEGIRLLKQAGIAVQINTTVARHNISQLPEVLQLAVSQGACALHLFLLVPTGCGREMDEGDMISPEEYENVLTWLAETSSEAPISVRATCAPHYQRIIRQRGERPSTAGCLAGESVCFVSSTGDVYPCGYLPLKAGNVIDEPLSRIWESSELLKSVRDPNLLKGKCAVCEFAAVCGGCRARAYAATGDYLAEEPCCCYVPRRA